MLIYPTTDDIIAFHENLVEIYADYAYPVKIVEGLNYPGAIDFIADFVTRDTLYGRPFLRNIFFKASYYLYNLNRLHPFVDGNKRTSLVTTYYFLRWNGYHLDIPDDAADFIIKIAQIKFDVSMKEVYQWIKKNSKRTILDTLRNAILSNIVSSELQNTPFFNEVIDVYLYLPAPKFIREAIARGGQLS